MYWPSRSRATTDVGREKKLRSKIVPNVLRLFTGLAIEYPVRRNLELVLEHLRPLAPLTWSPGDNFHITTKFIGEWPSERLDELKGALGGVAKRGPITTAIGGFGWFPNPHQPRVLFSGVKAPEALFGLAQDLDAACAALGVAVETRSYSPHLTLAKIRGAQNLVAVRQAIAQLPSAEFGVSTASKFLLYKSEPGETTSVYTVIGEFAL